MLRVSGMDAERKQDHFWPILAQSPIVRRSPRSTDDKILTDLR